MCDGRNHPLIDIYHSEESYGEREVVRWCPDCGGIVVDVDVDGRAAHLPGGIMKMRFPTQDKVLRRMLKKNEQST